MHPTLIIGKVLSGSHPLAVGRELIPCSLCCFAHPGAFIAHVSPKPCGFGFACSRVKQFNRRIIGKDGLSVQNMPPDGIGQWLKQGCGFANPIGQCRAIKINAVAFKDLGLAVQGSSNDLSFYVR